MSYRTGSIGEGISQPHSSPDNRTAGRIRTGIGILFGRPIGQVQAKLAIRLLGRFRGGGASPGIGDAAQRPIPIRGLVFRPGADAGRSAVEVDYRRFGPGDSALEHRASSIIRFSLAQSRIQISSWSSWGWPERRADSASRISDSQRSSSRCSIRRPGAILTSKLTLQSWNPPFHFRLLLFGCRTRPR